MEGGKYEEARQSKRKTENRRGKTWEKRKQKTKRDNLGKTKTLDPQKQRKREKKNTNSNPGHARIKQRRTNIKNKRSAKMTPADRDQGTGGGK